MTITNEEILRFSKDSLSNQWGIAIGGNLIYLLTIVAAGFIPFGLGSLLISGPLYLGLIIFSLNIVDNNKDVSIDNIFQGFDQFLNAFIANILVSLLVLMWTFLFIIPGIIAAIAYSQTFYIIKDNPTIPPYEAIQQSKAMMEGYKMQYFILMLQFLMLGFLCVLTLGIGFLWLMPFVNVAKAKFYTELKKGIIIDDKKLI